MCHCSCVCCVCVRVGICVLLCESASDVVSVWDWIDVLCCLWVFRVVGSGVCSCVLVAVCAVVFMCALLGSCVCVVVFWLSSLCV